MQRRYVPRAARRAMSSTARKIQTSVRRKTRQITGAPAKPVNRRVRTYVKRGKEARADVWIGEYDVDASQDGKIPRGVTELVDAVSQPFIARMRNGYTGYFVRTFDSVNSGQGKPGQRSRKGRLPIRKLKYNITKQATSVARTVVRIKAGPLFIKEFNRQFNIESGRGFR